MIDIPNFNPILALALFIPMLTKNKWYQYSLPIGLYCLFFGVHLSQIGLYASLLTATWSIQNMSKVKALITTGVAWHVFNLYSLALHPDGTYLGALEYDLMMIIATGIYLITFLGMRKLWQIALTEVLQKQ